MNVWKDYLWTGLHGNRFGGCMLILQLPISNTRIFKLHGFCQVIDVIAEKKRRKSEKNNFNEKQTWVKQVCTPAANDIFFLYRLTASIKNEEKKQHPHTPNYVFFFNPLMSVYDNSIEFFSYKIRDLERSLSVDAHWKFEWWGYIAAMLIHAKAHGWRIN